MKKYEEIKENEQSLVKEEGISYQHQNLSDVRQYVSKEELERDCLTLEESRARLLEKIHRHFHCS